MFEKNVILSNAHILYKSIHAICDWLLPSKCILCGSIAKNTLRLCKPCLEELPILPHHCYQCARFLPYSSMSRCGSCLNDAPQFQHTYALFPYESPIKSWITQLKFNHRLYYANTLGKLMADKIETSWYHRNPLPDLIIPIPLHRKRLQERGFNQALEIARPIAKKFSLPIDYKGIQRVKPTMPQSGLAAHERKRNMDNAFAISGNFSGLYVALVDDVITTGCTIRECARLLAKNGAAKIDIWCAARNG